MKKKILIICANYYKDINNGLLKYALKDSFSCDLPPKVFSYLFSSVDFRNYQ